LSDESQYEVNPRKIGPDGPILPEDSLESALDFVSERGRTTGEESFGIRQQIAVAQRDALIEWAEKKKLTIDLALRIGQVFIGGSEHDIWAEAGEYWKVTRPDRFGWTVLPGEDRIPEVAEATPLEYLERWAAANKILGDNVKLRGVVIEEDVIRVVISQKIIAGPYPNKCAVKEEMSKRGFFQVPFSIGSETDTTYYDDEHRIAAFDGSTDNFILSNGVPIPIDVIIIRVGDSLRCQLLDLIGL